MLNTLNWLQLWKAWHCYCFYSFYFYFYKDTAQGFDCGDDDDDGSISIDL